MGLHTRALAAVLGAVGTLSFAACNGGGSSVNPFAPSRGTLRVINGSPDVGMVDVAVGKANTPNFTGLPYAGNAQNASTNSNAGISQYTQFNAPNQAIYIYKSGTTQQISVPQTSVTITPNGRTTVVVTGSLAHKSLRLVTFSEHLFTTVQGAASVAYHQASQTYATSTFTVGYQAWSSGTPSCSAGFSTVPPPVQFAVSPPTFQEGLPAVASTGIAFCAQGHGALLTLLPSNLDAGNTGNVMPYTGSTAVNGDQNMSIYILDGPVDSGKPALVGVFDPDN
jgi:hypothetical protein